MDKGQAPAAALKYRRLRLTSLPPPARFQEAGASRLQGGIFTMFWEQMLQASHYWAVK